MTSVSSSSSSANLVLSPERGLAIASDASDREKLHAVAQNFEAIFVRQMLAAARKTSFDDGPLAQSAGLATFRQMQDDQFAQLAAQTGVLGLATMIEAQLARFVPEDTVPTSTTTGES